MVEQHDFDKSEPRKATASNRQQNCHSAANARNEDGEVGRDKTVYERVNNHLLVTETLKERFSESSLQ